MQFVGIIPARYASTRFPGKPLAMIDGQTMILRVYEQAIKVLDQVWVATDDKRIESELNSHGGNCLLTSKKHKSGTDRLAEASEILQEKGIPIDVVINIQGDEPFIQPGQIREIISCFEEEDTHIATLIRKISSTYELFNPNQPKVVVSNDLHAIYFSRQAIPHIRNCDENDWLTKHTFYKHIGMYAYKTEILQQISKLPQSPLEKAESLEQLRWIENGYKIKTAISQFDSQGIDTPEDLEKLIKKRT